MGNTNVVKDYDWTSIPRGSGLRNKAPYVSLTSYEIKSNQLMQYITSFLSIGDSGGLSGAKDYYDKLYSQAKKSDTFTLPFFGDSVRGFSNEFGETFQNGVGGGSTGFFEGAKEDIKSTLGRLGIAGGLVGSDAINKSIEQVKDGASAGDIMNTLWSGAKTGGDAGTYVEAPKFYQYENNDSPLEVSFVLSNTINDDYQKNTDLVKTLTKINRPLRKSSISVDPPRIYSVKVPGHRFIRWAYCSSFSVEFVGARKVINNVIVPEGYRINMSFQSLTLEHAGFMEDV